ncbi:MAG: LysR substrate-binding domain-containing protein [Janthinobacterium lividum]
MRRRVNLRQIEVFKAVIEHGTVTSAAAVLSVSQPALSKSLAQLEADTQLALFDRLKGRLAPTEQGMRFYSEIDRIFGGLQQIENAVDALHRHSRGQLSIGVMPALSGAFVQRVVTAFLQAHPGIYCCIEARSSEWIMESLVRRKLDVGVLSSRMDNPYVESGVLMEHAVVCIMPVGHRLAAQQVISPADLAGLPFVSFGPETAIGQRIVAVLTAHGVSPNIAVVTNIARTVCEFVAAGTGVSLVHPLMVSDYHRLVIRPFEPETTLGFLLSQVRDSRNSRLVESFMTVARAIAGDMLRETQVDSPPAPRSTRKRQQRRPPHSP